MKLNLAGLSGDAVSVALYAQQCHNDPKAELLLREVAGALAMSWTGKNKDGDISWLLCIACTQIALALAHRGEDASHFFARAVEAGRASVLADPFGCPAEAVLHLAVAECEVGDAAFGAQLQNSVSFAKLRSWPSASPFRELGSFAVAGKVVALMMAGQTRLASSLVGSLTSQDLPFELVAHLERAVRSASAREAPVASPQLVADMPDRLDAAVPGRA